jgi:galactose-1-phosphate uridylyltransferase
MRFLKVVRSAEMMSPPAFEADIQRIEFREDPLTGVPCRINIRRVRRPKQAQRAAEEIEVIEKPGDCPFCPENIERRTPLFPGHICAEGRIKRGHGYLFPNLFPFAEFHATATLAEEHFLELDQFDPEMLMDNMMATREYLLSVYKNSPQARYPLFIWNHLPPSAASIVHPHVQILVDRRPTPYQQRLLEASKQYFLQSGRSFWEDLVEEERGVAERYIGNLGSASVIASYAPQGNKEIQIISPGIGNLTDMGERETRDFAHCITRVLLGYKQMGVNSFNLSTFSGPIGERLDYYSLNAKLISRPLWQPFYKNDTGALERFHYEADIEMEPEALAQTMKPFLTFEGLSR